MSVTDLSIVNTNIGSTEPNQFLLPIILVFSNKTDYKQCIKAPRKSANKECGAPCLDYLKETGEGGEGVKFN